MSIDLLLLMSAFGLAAMAVMTQTPGPAYGAGLLGAVALMMGPGVAPDRLAMASLAAALAALVCCLSPRDVPRFAMALVLSAALAMYVMARAPVLDLAGYVDPLALALCGCGLVALVFGRLGLVAGPIALSLLPLDPVLAGLCLGLGLIAARLLFSVKEVSS